MAQARCLLLLLACIALLRTDAQAQTPPVVTENLKAGTSTWALTKPALSGEIEGYASLTSVNRGGTIKLFVNTSEPSYTINIYRMGWYGGLGGRQVAGPITQTGTKQTIPAPDTNNTVDCNWINPYTLTIPNSADPTDWCSGYYLAKLTSSTTGSQAYIIFVVRDDSRASKLLAQSSVNTYQAYNTWGGHSLYSFQSPNGRANKVSFNRPYALNSNPQLAYGNGAAEFLVGSDGGPPGGWEYCMVRFLEREGYDVTYCTNVDVHANPSLLRSHKGYLSVGHDEYWSLEMRQNVTAARDAGVSLGFFSANTAYWQVRLESSQATGDANRIVTCYKYFPTDYIGTDSQDPYFLDSDPSNDNQITIRFRDTLAGSSRVASPEEALIGVMYDYGADDANNDMVITNASSWVFANTGLKNGDHIPYVVGYECDRAQGNGPAGLTILAHSPYTGNTFTGSGFSDMTIYQAASGATVFATGSIQFAWALDDFEVPSLRFTRLSPAAQQMTRNLLNRFTGVTGTTPQLVIADTGGPYAAAPGFMIAFNAVKSTIPNGTTATYAWNFGDGTTGNNLASPHAYTIPGVYTVSLTVTDSLGDSSTSQTTATITGGNRFAQVTADSVFDLTSDKRYYYPPTSVGDSVVPVPTEADRFNQWFASSPQPMDTTTGILDTPISVYMTLTGRQTLTKVSINQAAWFDFPGFHSKDVNIYLRTTGAIWTKVASGTLQNVNGALTEITFPATPADEARVEVVSTYDTALYSSVGLAEVQFSGNAQPPLAVAGGPYAGDPGTAIAFSAAGSSAPAGSIVSYAWNFGDGATGTGATPTHTYSASGTYAVTLTITDNTGATATAPTTVTIRGRYTTVTADATFDTTSDKRYYYPPDAIGDHVVPVPAPEDQFKQWFAPISQPMDATGVLTTPLNVYVTFFAAQTVNSVLINQASWYDNIGFHTKAFNVYLHAPTAAAGIWTKVASGTLTNANGALATLNFAATLADSARIEIVSSYDTTSYNSVGLAEVEFVSVANVPPVANPGGPYTGIAGQPVTLDGTGSTDKDNNLASYSWNFGDGTAAGTGATPTHTYATAGAYTVTLTVTDALGAKSSATTTATIKTPIDLSGLTVSPTSVTGGASGATITGTVTLSGAAPTGGVTIALGSGNAAVTVPTGVVVPEGAPSAPFTITTSAVASDATVTLTATYAATTTAKTATLTVKAPVITTLTLSPTSVTSGATATGTVGLTGPAPTGGTTVTLTSGNAAAKVPTSVAVPAGASSATFTVTTTAVATAATASITGATGSASQSATLTVNPPTFTLAVAPTSVTGSANATGTVTLSSAAASATTITLASNNGAAQVPTSVVVAAGASSATFTVKTVAVASDATATLTATYGAVSKTATLTVKAPTVIGLTLNPSRVMGGNSTVGTVTISGPAPTNGLTVAVSDNSANSQVPVSVLVPAGATSATFTITTTTVTAQGSALVTAAANGSSVSATLTISAAGVSSITLNPSTVTGGSASTGTVTLNGPAPAGGARVTLRSGNSAAQVGTSVTVPAGASSAPFTVTTSRVTSTKQAVISASYAGTTKSATLTVKPIGLTSMTLNPSSVKGGTSFMGAFAIDAPAPAGGLTVNLTITIDGQTYWGTVTIPEGQTSLSQTYSTYAVTSNVTIAVKAKIYESSKSGNITITP